MPEKKSESEFINLVMSDASPEEREEATRRWFELLRILLRVVRRQEEEAHGDNLVGK